MRQVTAMLLLTAAVAVMIPSGARADSVPAPLKHAKAGDLGEVLTDPKGMTLYTFTADTEPGKSSCNATCASNWPPFRPEGSAAPKAPRTVISREDGTKQYAYKGKPLYYWKNDKKPGDTTGHKSGDRWFVAKP
jgi:predicted lipoprotein with Yx(FWY)xxD motif